MTEISKPTIEAESVIVSYPKKGVAQITIESKPLGVLRHAVKRALLQAIDNLEQNKSIRCCILTGTGKAFSVGSDIHDFSAEVGWLLENDYWEASLNQQIEEARFPVIAAINGYALGGGAVLTLACDIRIACESAVFAFPEVKVGAFASGSGTQRLPRLVGRGRALDLLLTGREITAQQALQYGMIEYVFEDDTFFEQTLALAEQIATYSGIATESTKACVNRGLREGWQVGLNTESDLRAKTGGLHDAIEGRNAFLEKRKPVFNQNEES